MVRFKNRYILAEFLVPQSLAPTLSDLSSTLPVDLDPNNQDEDDDIQSDREGDDDEDELSPIPLLPFVAPTVLPDLALGDQGGQAIYKAVKNVVQAVFGDEGWGRIASSFRVIYHSPLTTLTFIRIARHQYRLLWSAIAFMTSINGAAVLPRVVAVSGTIRKLQNRGIAYHRAIVGGLVSAGVAGSGSGGGGGALRWGKEVEREREEMGRLQETS